MFLLFFIFLSNFVFITSCRMLDPDSGLYNQDDPQHCEESTKVNGQCPSPGVVEDQTPHYENLDLNEYDHCSDRFSSKGNEKQQFLKCRFFGSSLKQCVNLIGCKIILNTEQCVLEYQRLSQIHPKVASTWDCYNNP